MNSTICITTKKKGTSSVPIVICKRKYAVLGESSEVFNWLGILYPLQRMWRSTTNFLNNWASHFYREIPELQTELQKEITILNVETGNFEKVEELPQNISILIQENINVNEY